MSFHHLGIAHYSPILHRQLSSPTSQVRELSGSSPTEDVTQDNKDVLIERLNDLIARLSSGSFEDNTISAFHSQVDRIEGLLRGRESSNSLDARSPKEARDDVLWGPPLSPTRQIGIRFPSYSPSSPRSPQTPQHQLQVIPNKVIEITKAAEELASKLAATVSELQTRKQESDHIHELLVMRSENAAQKIIQLAEMQDDFDANLSELQFLRIQLQAIEAQSSQYIPQDEQSEELTQSIRNWKIDWEDIDQRTKALRKKYPVSIASVGSARTIVDSS